MELLTYIGALVGAFLILVSVHEYGHFVVARKAGVQVQRFSIGLGPVLWRRMSSSGTEFVISWIPLGGYISMLDTRTQDDIPDDQKHMAFDQVAPWRQIAIAAAGPAANLLLALLLFWIVMFNGERVSVPYLGRVEVDTPAHQAGLRGGEEIVAFDDSEVEQWMDIVRAAVGRVGDTGTISIKARTDSGERTYVIPIENWLRDESDPDVLGKLGISQDMLPMISEVMPDTPASHAGFLPNDRFISIDNEQILVWGDLVNIVRPAADRSVDIVFERDGLQRTVSVIPEGVVAPDGSVYGMLGVAPVVETRVIGTGIGGSFTAAARETWNITALTVTSIKKMVVGDLDTSNLAGPITIAHLAGSVAQRGWDYYLRLVAILSVSLCLINLLPIPVLDGGHIVYGLIEAITRKRVSMRIQRVASMTGIAMIGCLIILALYNDFSRLMSG